jgi:hypothetical protein
VHPVGRAVDRRLVVVRYTPLLVLGYLVHEVLELSDFGVKKCLVQPGMDAGRRGTGLELGD